VSPAACADCLRRAGLVGMLAPRIAGLLDRPRNRRSGVLALDEETLIAAVAGPQEDAARRFLAEFDVRATRRRLNRAGVEAVCGHDDAYPPGLRELDDPPAVLHVLGGRDRLEPLHAGRVAAVVGARRASSYARETAYELGRGLGAAGTPVVSGLAMGVDGASHRGALDGGGTAVAVLAGGVDVVSPRTNRSLYERIAERGAVVSELPLGTPAYKWSFPARNRIMAALADLTVVVEAAESSGSLITAAFAHQLGRDVGAVPGRVNAAGAAGGNRLLREGAPVIRGPVDALDELHGVGAAARGGGLARTWSPDPPLEEAQQAAPSGELDDRLVAVLNALGSGEGLEGVARDTGLGPGEVRAALAKLELLDYVASDGLGGYQPTGRARATAA
jgi:DNA processing protein